MKNLLKPKECVGKTIESIELSSGYGNISFSDGTVFCFNIELDRYDQGPKLTIVDTVSTKYTWFDKENQISYITAFQLGIINKEEYDDIERINK
jgi:hypothetical protein